jgi:hypothetical protein
MRERVKNKQRNNLQGDLIVFINEDEDRDITAVESAFVDFPGGRGRGKFVVDSK